MLIDSDKKVIKDNIIFCSFCRKSQDEVKKLISGTGVFICNECVTECQEVVYEDQKKSKSGKIVVTDDIDSNCSFCETSQKKVNNLLAGSEFFICYNCIDTCLSVIYGDQKPKLSKTLIKEETKPQIKQKSESQEETRLVDCPKCGNEITKRKVKIGKPCQTQQKPVVLACWDLRLIAKIEGMLGDDDWKVRNAVVEGLVELTKEGKYDDIAKMEELRGDGGWYMRSAAVKGLVELTKQGKYNDIAKIEGLLEDSREEMRIATIEGLVELTAG